MTNYEVYSNPVKGKKSGSRRFTAKRKPTTRSQRTSTARTVVYANPIKRKRKRYATRHNPVTNTKGLMGIGIQVVASALGAVGLGAAANKIAQQMGKPNSTVQGLVGLGLSAGLIYLGKQQNQPHLVSAGLGAAGFSGLYTANKITTGNDKQSPLSNVLAGNVSLAGDPEVQYAIEAPAVDSGVFAGFELPAVDSGVFAK